MGSRARVAAAACLVASGLLVGGIGTATAFAHPGQSATDDPTGKRHDDAVSVDRKGDNHDRGDGGDRDGRGDRDDGGEKPRGDHDEERPASEPDDGELPVREEEPVDENDPEGDPEVPSDGSLEVPGREEEGEKEPPPKWPPPCCEKGDEDCGPWWPWPWPEPEPEPDPDDPPKSDNGGSDDPPVGLPGGGFPLPGPPIGLPPIVPPIAEPLTPDVVNTVPGVGVATSGSPGAPVSVPVLVAAPAGPGPITAGPISAGPTGAGSAGSGTGAGLPAAPRQGTAEPAPARQPLPATAGSNIALPASSYRVGYGEYLRTARFSQIAALALPGVAGILVLTGAGGLLGYRQAKAGHAVRTTGTARFMN